jgi:hypothetical protein
VSIQHIISSMSDTPLAPYDGSIQEGSKVLQKLVDLAREHLEPWRVARLGKAEAKRLQHQTDAVADRIVRMAEAESEGEKIRSLARLKLAEWDRQQQNREAVVAEAIKYLPAASAEASPSPDWMNEFFHSVENISERELRTIFVKLLAGEVGKPGTFSRRAISIVREMRADDVNRLDRASSLFWFLDISGPGGGFVPAFIAENAMPQLFTSDDLFRLADMGLLRVLPGLKVLPSGGSVLRYGSHRFKVGDRANLGIPAVTTTTPADELFRVFDKNEHLEYLERSLAFFKFPTSAIEFSPLT